MVTLLAYVFGLLLVGGLLFLVASFAFGRGEEMVPVLPEGTPLELPDDRPADGQDLRDLRLSVVARGYRMDEVDWLLDRLAEQVDARDREIARLHSVLHVEPIPVGAPDAEQDRVVATRSTFDRHPPDRPGAGAADGGATPAGATAADRADEPADGDRAELPDRERAGLPDGERAGLPDRDRAGLPDRDRPGLPDEDPVGPEAEAEWSRPEDERR